MVKRILVPIMSSTDYGASSLKYAIDMAKIYQATIRGVFIKDIRLLEGGQAYIPDPNEDLVPIRGHLAKKGQTIREFFSEECKKARVKAEFIVKEGLISTIICRESKKADLIVMGKKGESSPWLSGHLGSAAIRVIDNTQIPLMVVDEKYRKINHVLLSYSGGLYASKTIDTAKHICKRLKAKMSILTVMKDQGEAALLQTTAKAFFKSQKTLRPAFDVAPGDPVRGLKNYLTKSKANLVVFGSSKRTVMSIFYSNHLAKHILKSTDAPVLLIR